LLGLLAALLLLPLLPASTPAATLLGRLPLGVLALLIRRPVAGLLGLALLTLPTLLLLSGFLRLIRLSLGLLLPCLLILVCGVRSTSPSPSCRSRSTLLPGFRLIVWLFLFLIIQGTLLLAPQGNAGARPIWTSGHPSRLCSP
jgi:hypothetical protein